MRNKTALYEHTNGVLISKANKQYLHRFKVVNTSRCMHLLK